MPEKKINEKVDSIKIISCFNCGYEVKDLSQIKCPKCKIILDPNNYIRWKRSFYLFLCLLIVVPILVTILILII